MKSPTTVRVEAIADHMESLGAYTQANEVRALGFDRDKLADDIRRLDTMRLIERKRVREALASLVAAIMGD